MKSILIIALGILVIIIDGIVMPALFHVQTTSLLFVFLIALILSQGFHTFVIGAGILIAFIAELWYGFYFGTMILSWLTIVALWQILINFFNLKPLAYVKTISNFIILSCLGAVLVQIMSLVFLSIERIVYNHSQSFNSAFAVLRDPSAWAERLLAMLILFAILNMSFRSPQLVGRY